MLVKIINMLGNDLKAIGRSPVLLIICMTPLLLMLTMLLGFTPVSDYILQKSGFDFNIYYPLAAITMVSSAPVFPGLVFTLLPYDEVVIPFANKNSEYNSLKKHMIFTRLISSFLLSLIMIIIFMIFIMPVQSEGWLRSLFIAIMLAFQSPFVFLFLSCFSVDKLRRVLGLIFYFFLIAAVPLGLLSYHPWNYLAFISPLYWIAWSWVIGQPSESMLYGVIYIFITAGSMLLFCRQLYKKLIF